MSSQATCTVRGMGHDRTDGTSAEGWVAATGLLAAAVLAVKSPRLDRRHYWVHWTIAMVVYALVAAACVYAFINCLE